MNMYVQMIKNNIFGDVWESGMSINTSIIDNEVKIIISEGVYLHVWKDRTEQEEFLIKMPKTNKLLNSIDIYLLNGKIEYVLNEILYEPSIVPLYRLSVQIISNRIYDIDISDLRGMKMDKKDITLIRGKKIERLKKIINMD